MKFVDKAISVSELKEMSQKMFNNIVKAVVDIEKEVMVVDAGLQADEELLLLDEYESKQEDLWGINFHPDLFDGEDWIEFDSMINMRPSQGNRSRGVENPHIQKRIRGIVKKLVTS